MHFLQSCNSTFFAIIYCKKNIQLEFTSFIKNVILVKIRKLEFVQTHFSWHLNEQQKIILHYFCKKKTFYFNGFMFSMPNLLHMRSYSWVCTIRKKASLFAIYSNSAYLEKGKTLRSKMCNDKTHSSNH